MLCVPDGCGRRGWGIDNIRGVVASRDDLSICELDSKLIGLNCVCSLCACIDQLDGCQGAILLHQATGEAI